MFPPWRGRGGFPPHMGPRMGGPMMGNMGPRPPLGPRAPFGRGGVGGRGSSRGARPVEYFERPGGPSLGVFVGEVSGWRRRIKKLIRKRNRRS